MARRSKLESRLLAILDPAAPRCNPGRKALAAALAAALLIAIPLSTVHAQSAYEHALTADVDTIMAAANASKNMQMLEQTAVAYEKLRKFAEAQKLREAGLAIRESAGNPQIRGGLNSPGRPGPDAGPAMKHGNSMVKRCSSATFRRRIPHSSAWAWTRHSGSATLPWAAITCNGRATPLAIANRVGRAMTRLTYLDREDPAKAVEVESQYRTAISMEQSDSSEQAFTTELLSRFLSNAGRTRKLRRWPRLPPRCARRSPRSSRRQDPRASRCPCERAPESLLETALQGRACLHEGGAAPRNSRAPLA